LPGLMRRGAAHLQVRCSCCGYPSQDVFIEGLNDSKKLTENQREKLFDVINDKAIGAGIGIVDEKQIDEINILNATKKAMNWLLAI